MALLCDILYGGQDCTAQTTFVAQGDIEPSGYFIGFRELDPSHSNQDPRVFCDLLLQLISENTPHLADDAGRNPRLGQEQGCIKMGFERTPTSDHEQGGHLV